ncbi:MAG: hypothetical protein KDA87_25110, partial [Planctomycetales bacterium]|nr:hypothetical protein [Planctomycetales bacterium]
CVGLCGAKFDAGDLVRVYYDPQSPKRSVIDRESSPWWNYVVLAFSILVPSFGHSHIRGKAKSQT